MSSTAVKPEYRYKTTELERSKKRKISILKQFWCNRANNPTLPKILAPSLQMVNSKLRFLKLEIRQPESRGEGICRST